MRAKALFCALVWVSNLQIAARGEADPGPSYKEPQRWDWGSFTGKIQPLSSRTHQIRPNLSRECQYDFMPALTLLLQQMWELCVRGCERLRERENEGKTDD